MTVTYNKTTRFVVNENFVFRHDMEAVAKKMLAYAHSVAFPLPPEEPKEPKEPEEPEEPKEPEEPEESGNDVGGKEGTVPGAVPDPIEEPDNIPEPDPVADKRIVIRLEHNIGTDWNYIVFMKVHGDYDGKNLLLLNKNQSVGVRYYFPQSYTKVCQSCVPTGWSENDKCVCK